VESGDGSVLQKRTDRREALRVLLGGLAAGTAAAGACAPLNTASPEERELKVLEWEQFTQKHYRRMTSEERAETIQRLERLPGCITTRTSPSAPPMRYRESSSAMPSTSRSARATGAASSLHQRENLDRRAGNAVHPHLREGERRGWTSACRCDVSA
jgi:hypothetical protein